MLFISICVICIPNPYPGATTWLAATSPVHNLTEISIRNGAQVVFSGDNALFASGKINDDGSGYVYVAPKTKLHLETHLESCTQLYNGGFLTIQNNGTSTFAIKRDFSVYGAIDGMEKMDLFYGTNGGNWTMYPTASPRWLKFRSLTIGENSGVILESNVSQAGWRIEVDGDRNIQLGEKSLLLSSIFDHMKAKKISFQKGTSVEFNRNSALESSIRTEELLIEGSVEFGMVSFGSILRKFHLGQSGRVNLITRDFSLKDFECNGSMTFMNDTKISADIWSVGPVGHVNFINTSTYVVLQAHTVTVDGLFNPGRLSTGTGWQLLQVGPAGFFTFITNTSVIVDILDIKGTVRVNGTIKLQKRDFSGKSLITIGEGGKFILDDYSPCVNRSKYTGISELLALNVTVNGIFHVGKMSLGPGWDNLVIGSKGDVGFIPEGYVKIDRLITQGKLRTDTIVVLKSKAIATEEIETFEINSGGTVDLNCSPDMESGFVANSSDIAKNHASQLFAKNVRVDGSFVARKLYIGLGWDTFNMVASNSRFTVHPIGWFSFDEFKVNGLMTSQAELEIQGKSSQYLQRMHIMTWGHLQSVNNATDILVNELLVEGRFETGLLSIGRGLDKLTVGGSMSFNHTKEFKINTAIITGTLQTWTPFTSAGKYIGDVLNVTGSMKIDYQGAPQQDGGNTPSVLLINNVQVSGSANFGSLDLVSNSVTISGTLSADYGGALGNKGKGKPLCALYLWSMEY